MRNHGYYTASLSEMVRWLGEQAEALGVNLFPGFPVDSLLVDGAAGAGRADHAVRPRPGGRADANYAEPTELTGGSRCSPRARGARWGRPTGLAGGHLLEPADLRAGGEGGLGDEAAARPGDPHAGLALAERRFRRHMDVSAGPSQVSLGLVVGLDYHSASLDVHELLQRIKLHPLFRPVPRGRRAARVGGEDDPRGGLLRAARAPLGRRAPDGR